MTELAEFFHYATIALVVAINSIGVGIGEGLASSAALDAINIQPNARDDIIKAAVIGMALIDTAAIMGVTIALWLLFGSTQLKTMYTGTAELGIALAVCLPGFVLGLVSALPTQQACLSIARQPFFSQKILRFMLVTQSLIQSPIIFGFIIAMFIKDFAVTCTTMAESLRLLACGLSIGLGSIGPAIGLAQFAKTACHGIGINRQAYNKLFTFTFVSEAVIETPIIFALVVSLFLLNVSAPDLLSGIAMLAASISIGIGTIAPGISSGRAASAACNQIALHPEQYSTLSKTSLFAQGLIDTSAIYALIVALLMFRFT